MKLPPALERVVASLARLPGVGEKTATRFAFHILGQSDTWASELAHAVGELHGAVQHCECCHNLSEGPICAVCKDSTRDPRRVCVTEGIQDLIAIERAGEFDGRYHVLHGVLSPVKGIGPDQLRIDTLIKRLEPEGIEEVIVVTNVDVEGEATALLLQRLLEKRGVTVTRIATGVPMGGELEYLDQVTLARALRDRRPI